MKNSILALCIIIYTTGCASLHSKVYDNIHEGDNKAHVLDVLGAPKSFSSDSGTTTYVYAKNEDKCSIGMQGDLVIKTACENTPDNSPNAVAAFFKGYSDSVNARRQNETNCTTDYWGGSAHTSCH